MGYVLGALFFGRYLRRSRTNTLAEFFGQRFNSKRVQVLAGITIVLALGGYLLAVTQGAAILLAELTDLSYVQALVVAWLSYTTFTLGYRYRHQLDAGLHGQPMAIQPPPDGA